VSIEKNHARAVRYRKLALAELDREKANLLNRIADEAERGILCTVDRSYNPSSIEVNRSYNPSSIEIR
jgi:hypothetical protein